MRGHEMRNHDVEVMLALIDAPAAEGFSSTRSGEEIPVSKEIIRKAAAGPNAVTASMVAMVTCALAGDASARPSAAQPGAELSTRIAAIAEQIRVREPALARELPPERKIAFRN